MDEVIRKIEEELNIRSDGENLQKKDKEEIRRYININFPIDDVSVEERIVEPMKYLMSSHGKNFRQKMLIAMNFWMKASERVTNLLSKAGYLVHNVTLVLDDIQDRSLMRRGKPCTHLIYGNGKCINLFHFLVGSTMSITTQYADLFPDKTQMRFLSMAGRDIVLGQVMDVYWRDNYICPTEGEYKLMVIRKTGSICLLFYKVLDIYGRTEDLDKHALLRLLTCLGLYFQINDDYINLWSVEYQKTKGFCEDITEGKFSYPIVYVINNFPEEGKIIKDILSQRTRDVEVLTYCRSIIEKCGGQEYTRNAIHKYKNIILEEKAKLSYNAIFEEVLQTEFFTPESPLVI
ncbi:hypothetical protein ILUMI_13865 [Ignelater luminosus]|uniref:Geranylgeranyl pyrophosphate synthase n=1 Tax=Ignelater luminosus TaxID=2038154 RepID=A0A8K0CVX2_IGNLU|nr:hypothetical protein ILUMI_13865 [Ignelater luminosus]